MTPRYVEVVQLDLQREFHRARQKTASLYSIPQLPLPTTTAPTRVDITNIAATHHLLQLLQPQLEDKARRMLRRLTQRLLNIDHELDYHPQNECTLASQSAVIPCVQTQSHGALSRQYHQQFHLGIGDFAGHKDTDGASLGQRVPERAALYQAEVLVIELDRHRGGRRG
jgi:hypothetical protein